MARGSTWRGRRTYFGTGSDLPNILDLETGERRLSLLSDVADTARLADSLANLDFVMSMALPSDVPSATSDRRSFLTMIENTTKPLVFTAWDEGGLADIVAMAEVVAGGAEQLSLNPFLLAYLEPSSPLQHSETVLAKMMIMADKRLPFVYAPGPVEGASAPVTPAGSLVMANAEILSGITIAQLRRRGTPGGLRVGQRPSRHAHHGRHLLEPGVHAPLQGLRRTRTALLPSADVGLLGLHRFQGPRCPGRRRQRPVDLVDGPERQQPGARHRLCRIGHDLLARDDRHVRRDHRLCPPPDGRHRSVRPRIWPWRRSTRSARAATTSRPTTP